MNLLCDRENYTADISYLNNVFITEYDISKANISILRSMNVIDQGTYNWLYRAERMKRQIYVGNLAKNKEIAHKLTEGFRAARHLLFQANNILDREVLSIKKDAIFVINRKLQNTEFGLIHFVPKNTYTGFYKLNNMEIYYYYNKITEEEVIEVKGINNDRLKLHEGYFLQLLKDIFYTLQVNGPEVALRMLKDYYISFITRQLPMEHYRRFGGDNSYHTTNAFDIVLDTTNTAFKDIVDINYNAVVLMELQKIIVDIYFTKHR